MGFILLGFMILLTIIATQSTANLGSLTINLHASSNKTSIFSQNIIFNQLMAKSVIPSSFVIATIPVGANPFSITFNPSGTLAYVINQGTYQNNYTGSITVINTSTNKVITTIPVGANPSSIIINPSAIGTLAYVINQGSITSNNSYPSSISVINTSTNKVITTIPVEHEGQPVVVFNPSGTRAYITNPNSFNITVINTSTNKVIATIPVYAFPSSITFNPSATRAYVVKIFYGKNHNYYIIAVINTSTNKVITNILVGSSPFHAAYTTFTLGIHAPTQVAFNPSATRAYVVNQGITNNTNITVNAGNVSVINTSTNKVISTIPVGANPSSLVFNPSATLAYVINQGTYQNNYTGSITVINTSTNKVIATIPVYASPSSLVFNPSGTHLYVLPNLSLSKVFSFNLSYVSSNVSVINTITNKIISVIPAGLNSSSITFNPSATLAYVTKQGTTNNNYMGMVDVINIKTNRVVTTIPTGLDSFYPTYSNLAIPTSITFNPSATLAYITNYDSGTVIVINTTLTKINNSNTSKVSPIPPTKSTGSTTSSTKDLIIIALIVAVIIVLILLLKIQNRKH